jgi:nitrogen fixation NifU-like protein
VILNFVFPHLLMLDLVSQYYDNPVNKAFMKDATISRHEGNSICGDDITVYLKIENDTITARSYDGNTSMITTAAASFFSELIGDKTLDEVLQMTYENTLIPEGFEVSPRRKRAGAIAILATRNAIHQYRKDSQQDTRDNVVEL